MKFELKFDEDIFRNQMDLLRDLAWKDKIVYYKNSHFLGIFLFIIGCMLFYERPNLLGITFIIFSLGILIPYIYYYFKIKSSYKGFEAAKIKEIEANKNLIFHWEFTEQCLIEKVLDYERVFNWDDFIVYLIRDNNLLLITKNHESMILGEVEVGKENFEEIIDFVEKRNVKKNKLT
ncbi:hypothetical protein [Flavobacterium polysaccharolyticum]|uniref:YcxB-like protein n=1 Tax=Flavobacterium polysaccharolyticum TaxID=3133148 RepID=A0ABU9NNG3_9FLAO